MDDPLFTAKCNCLFKMSNVETRLPIKSAVRRVGNWVGGTVLGYHDRIVFKMNALNAKFQADSSDIVVFYDEISGVRFGRLMRFFKTVDADTASGLLRFRGIGKGNDRLLTFLQERLADRG